MQKILFIRKFKKVSGGQIKVRDYFRHCRQHLALAPSIYFTPDSTRRAADFWVEVSPEQRVDKIRWSTWDLLFLAGRDWEYIPEIPEHLQVINYIQHVRHADPGDKRHRFLSRPALRICVSREVAEAIAPYACGEIVVIENGICLDRFRPDAAKVENSILILACKNPDLGRRLVTHFSSCGRSELEAIFEPVPQEALAKRLARADLFVALPNRTEGFYLPALEGMASGCAVICSDAIGNRSFCRHDQTCLMPAYDDFIDHVQMIEALLADPRRKARLQHQGLQIAHTFSLASERAAFYQVLEKHFGILPTA